jgi:hypothetical protein
MPALIFPAPGYIAVDSSSILSTSTWCSSDSLGAIGKLKTQSTIVASTIKLDVPKVSLSRKLTTNSVNLDVPKVSLSRKLTTNSINFTPSALKKGFRTKSVDSSILTTSTNRLESTVNTTTFVYTQTSVTTTLAPITARERLFYAQLVPGKYGQLLPYNDNRIIDVVSSQIKASVLSKPIAILRPDIKSRISTGLLAKPITILKADSARVSNTVTNIPLVSRAIFGNKLPRTYTTSSIKAINIDIQLPITGSSGSTADTVSWYINDQDILTVVSVGTPLVTLYFARSIYAPLAGSTVGLVNSNIGYSRQISIISATEGSITFTDPGDLPSISSMYIATVTSQNIIDYVTTVYLDNSTKIFDTPSVAKIKTVTSLKPDSNRSIGVENTNTKFSRLESTVNTTTFVYTQTSVSTTLAPTTARGRLYYAQIAPGKYGQMLTYNGSSITQGILVPGLGKTASVAKLAAMSSMVTRATLQKPVALLKAGDTGSYNTNTSLPMVNKVIFGKKIPRAYTTATVRTVTTDIVIPITGRTGSTADTVSWYINDQDVLTVIPQGSALVTLYFARTVYPITSTVILTNSVTGYSRKVSVLSNTDGSITFTDPGDLPSISAMSMIITTARDIIDYSTVTYLDDGIKAFDVPGTYKLSRINTLKADNSRIPIVGKTKSITRLIGKTTIGTSGNLQNPVAVLRADSSYSSKVYVGTDTTQVFYDTTIENVIQVTTTARSGTSDTNNLIDWLEDDTDILNVTNSSPAVPLLTIYIGRNSIVNPQSIVQLAGASFTTTASIVSFTSNSITIIDTGLIPSPIDNTVLLYWTKARSVITTTVTSNNTNKIALVNKATFGSRIPRAYTTSSIQTISVDTAIYVTGSSGSTADTVSWYINDQDILTVIPQGSALVTLYFVKQPRFYFTVGSSVKLFNYLNGYSKQVTIISSTDGSITFTDPGDIPSTSGLQLIFTETQTVFRSVTNSILENGIEIFNAPTVSNLTKSIIVLKSDSTSTKASGVLNKPVVSLRDGPPIIPTPGKVTSAIVLRPDTNQRSGLYTTATGTALVTKAIFGKNSTRAYTTATTRTVTTDILIPITGISGSTADTVSWYINDQDILTVIPQGSALVTLYFAKSLYSLGSSIKIVNTNIGYTKTLSVISSTDGSVTVTNPGDLPSISGMSIVISISRDIIDYSTYAYLDSGTQMFDVPRVAKLSRAISVKSVPAQIQTIGKAKIVSKLVPSIGVGIPLSLQKQITTLKADNTQRTATYSITTQVPLVNKITFGGRIPRAYTTSTTSVIYVDTPWPITGRSGSTADTVNWYINDQDILTTTNVPGSEVTLYFAQQNLQVLSPGLQVRLVNWTIGYTRLITLTAVTNASITFADPGDLPSISGLNILLSVPQTVVNSSAVTQFESSNELVDTPKSGNLSKSSIRLRTDAAKLQTAPGKVTSAIVIRADNNQRSSTYNTTTQISLVNKVIFGKKIPRAYTTSTLNLVTTDVQIPIISRTGSTADTVSWYINDQDILTIIPQGSALVTLYFARPADNVVINSSSIKLINTNIGYAKQISIISKTENSITFADTGDLPSISNMFIIGTTSQYVVNYSTVAYLDDSTEIFYTPTSGNTSFKSTRQLFAEPARIQTPGKTKSISKLIAGTRIPTPANLQKQFATLKADSNQRTATYSTATQISVVNKVIFGKNSTRAYTTATTRTVTSDILIPVTGISGSTADTIGWYINDQDILTVIPLGSALVTLYFAKSSYAITGTVRITNTNIGYSKLVSVTSSTDGSITFVNPGDLPSISSMYIVNSITQSIIDYQTYAYLDSGTQMFDVPKVSKLSTITQLKSDLARVQTVGKTAFINRLIGKTAPGTSGNLQKQAAIIKGDNNQRAATYSTTTQISVVNKVTFGGRIPRAYTSSTTTTIYVDTPWPVTGRGGSTADTVNWYIYDQDILNTAQSQEATVTLYFAKQTLQILTAGSLVRLINWVSGYTKQVILTSATESSITFTDPGDLPSISGLSILLSVPQIVVDNTSITRLESGNELVNTPKSGNLSKSSIILKADSTATKSSGLLNKSIVKLISGPSIVTTPGKVKSAIVLRPDSNQRSSLYTTATGTTLINKAIFGKRSTRAYTTATTRTVTTDLQTAVISRTESTADTVSWYINDQDILTVIPTGSPLVTLYFATAQLGSNIRITNFNSGYNKSISVINITNNSITFSDPGDLPSISGMYIVSSTTQNIVDFVTYAYVDSSSQIFDVPRASKLSAIIKLKSDLARVQTPGRISTVNKLIGKTAPGTSGNLQKQAAIIKGDNNQRAATYSTTTQISLVNKVTFGGRIPRAYTSSTTTTIYVDTPWPVTGRSGSTADTVNWYIYDQDILNTAQSQEATVTLYFSQQNLQTLYPGLQIRLLNWTISYTRLVTLTAATSSSITFADPGDLPSISGLSILLSVPQIVVDNTSITRFESGNELVNTPKSGNLVKSLIVLRAESTSTKSSGLLNKSLVKLISGPSIVTRPGKVKSAIVLRPDTNQRSSLYTTATGTALVNKAIFGKNVTRAATTATTRTVTTDVAIPVTGISMSKSTADTVNWYINDQDILTVIPVGTSLVTFFFANAQLASNIRITNGSANYVRSISAISITNNSITFSDPGDLPSIGEMYILSSTTQSVIDYQTYTYLDSGTQMFDVPRVAKLSRAIAVKADSVRIQTPSTLSKNTAKLVSAANVSGLAKLTRSILVKGIPFTASTVTNIPLVNKAIFGKKVPQAYTSATTRTIYTDIQISVIGITGSTADTVSWYINDQDILTVIPVGSALVTLYFAKQNQNYFSVGSQVRVFNSNIGYNQLVILTSFTDGSITFVNPGNLPSISGMYVIATQSQNIIDYITVSNLDYSTSIFSIPTVNSLIKSQIQIRSPRTISSAYTLTNTANRLESTVNTTTFVYTQTSVTTTLAPTTARERLYYAQVAPGRYGQIITYNGSSIAPGGILSTATNRLESTVNTTTFVYTQTSVTTTLAPTNARERLYYAQLAAGKYGITVTYNGRSVAPGGILSTATNRLESTVNTTTFVYTQTSVTTTLAPTTARERLYYAQVAPGRYGITLTYNGKSLFSGPNVPATDALQQRTRDNKFYGIAPIEVNRNLEFFNDTNLMGEISFPVRYQLTNVLTTSNSIAAYIYDYDILTYSTYQDPSPTRTFSLTYNSLTLPSSTSTNANYVPFAVGSTVKVSSKKAKYANTFTVVQSNYISVTVSDNPSIPTLPDTDDVIISGLPSVYPIASVSTNAAPTTARENLYYFNLSPGLRSGRNLTVGEVSRIPSVAKLKSSLVVKALPNNLSASVTSRVPIKLSSDSIRLTTSKLTQATARLQADRSTIRSSNLELIYFVDYFSSSTVTTSTFVVPTVSVQTNLNPQNPREMLYYAQMGPSVRGGGITLTAFGKQTGDTNAKLLINTINKNVSPLKADSTKIAVGKTNIPSILVGRPSLAQSGNLQKALQVLKADSSYPTKSYTATDTTSTVYDTYSLPVISRSGYTANTVNWYIDDQDVLTVTDTGSGQITLYFAPSQYSLDNSVVSLIQSTIGYNKQISSYTYTNSSITFDDPGDLPNVNGMIISWAKPRTVVSTTVTGQDTNKTPLVSKAIFGKKLPQPRITAVTKIIYVDTFLPILSVSRAIATANTVDWYIEDRDVLTITQLSGDVVTLLFARQLTQNFNIGDQIRLVDPVLGYNKQVTVTSLTETSVTFTDPGDLITSSSLSIQLSLPKTVNEFQTTTYLDTNTEIFESPTSSNLVKSSIKLRSDIAKLQTMPGKVPLKVVDGPPNISRSLANLQKPLIQLRPDSSYSSPTYTSTTTTSIIYDNYSVAVIGNNLSTADTVNWYINDQDVLTITPVGTGLVTLYFAPGADSVAGASLQIVQANIGYSRTITSFTYTASSITFTDPGDLPSTGGMTINWSRPRTTVTAAAIGQNLNKIPLVTKALFGKKLPQARVSSVTRTIDIDAYITITSINRTGSTADTVNWYINDNDILTTSATTENLITLFFDKQNLQIFAAGDVIRLADYSIDYIKQVTLVSAEPGFVTFIDPGDLASSSNNLKIIVSSSQTVTDFQTTTYLDSSTEIFESPLSSNLVKSSIKLRSDVAKLQTISGKVPLKLAGSIPSITKPGKIISRAILRPDSSYSSPTYTSTSTTSVVYDSYYALVTGSSETGVTTDAVSWYIDDKDILTVVPSGSKLLTLFFDPIQDSLSGLTVTVSHGPTNYYKVITDFTSTRSSITFPNPGDIFSTSGMILTWTKPRTLITATAIGQNLNKIPLVNKAIFGKKLPQARVSSVTRTIYVDTPLPVVGRSGSTADTVNWYIYDQDILTTVSSTDSTVTLYLAKQNIQTFTAGSQVRLANYLIGYVKQVTVISATDSSITFNDPGDLPSISGLNVIASIEKTITDFQTATYLDNSTEIFESPTISNLVKSPIKILPDTAILQIISGKVPIKVTDGPPNISRSLASLQKSLIQLRPDSSYGSPSYTSTSTTSVTYDNYSVAVTGSSRSLVTADTVNWYINDQDILTVTPVGAALVTLYFTPGSDSVAGATLQLFQARTGYSRTISSFSYTDSSITFADPGDLPSTGDMTINWSRPKVTVTATAIGQNLNKIPLVTKALFGKKLPQPRTVAVTTTIYVDSPIPVLTVNRPISSADTVAWYIEDKDILTTSSAADSTVTLIFAQQTLKKFTAGEQIRLADYALNYVKQVTVISATDTSVTFSDPGDLVATNSLNILVSVAQTITDSQTTTYLESSIEIFDTPKISSLDRRLTRNLEQFRAEPAAFNTIGRVKVPLKLIPTSGIFTADKLLAFAILKADRNNLAAANIATRKTAFAKLTDDVSIKLVLGRGNIVKLHTGNFKLGSIGIQDPAAQKKEPIQFWN